MLLRRIALSVLVVACLAGAAFVIADTWVRGTPTADVAPASENSTNTSVPGETTASTFPVASNKNPFQALVQLPATATTQPK